MLWAFFVCASPAWLIRAILAIYHRQTQSEKENNTSILKNNVGFNKPDSYFLSNIATIIQCVYKYTIPKQYYSGILSEKQIFKCKKLMLKYSKQLTCIANSN